MKSILFPYVLNVLLLEVLSTNKMNSKLEFLLKTTLLLFVSFGSTLCEDCECDNNGTNIVEQYCRSEFMVKIKIISEKKVTDNKDDQIRVWYDFELVKFVKMTQGSRTALNSHKIWTVDSECGRIFKKGRRFIITGELITESEPKGITSACKYGVQKENLTKFDEEFFRIKHAKEKCKNYPKIKG